MTIGLLRICKTKTKHLTNTTLNTFNSHTNIPLKPPYPPRSIKILSLH